MDFTIFSWPGLALCCTFFAAGVVDAVCGGGGLLTLPAFMMVGFPVHLIAGTNQCSIILGGGTSLARFARNGCIHWKTALPTVPPAILGAYLGARLNLLLPAEWLQVVMIVLLPIVALLVLVKRDFGAENHVDSVNMRRLLLSSLLVGLGIGTYQGFYGAGAGMFYLLAFAALLRLDLTTASGNTKVVSFCSVIASSMTYAFSGAVVWPAVAAATVFNIAGSYVGAGLAMKKGARFIRPMFLAVLALMFLRLVLDWLL